MSGSTVRAIGPVVTIPPVRAPLDLQPCRFCGSRGTCKHLVMVIHLDGQSVGVRAEMGAEAGRQRLEGLRAALICCSADGGTDG